MYIVTRLISDVHFLITGQKLTFKTYNYRLCDTSMFPKTADYFPSGGVIATLLGNCKVFCYANMNVTLFRVLANQIAVFSKNTTKSVIIQNRSDNCHLYLHFLYYIYSWNPLNLYSTSVSYTKGTKGFLLITPN